MSVELEARVRELEGMVRRLEGDLRDLAKQGASHNTDISKLASKIDQMIEELKSIREMPKMFVPRHEIDARLEADAARIEQLQISVTNLQATLNTTKDTIAASFQSVSSDMHNNTKWTIGTLIGILMALIGILFKLAQGH